MKISIVGPAHPYRGGLAVIMQSMARVFQHRGDEVKIKTFTLQYPRIFFPGRNQTVQTPPPPDLYIVRCVNTMNPFNWIAVGRWIAREKPDFVLMKYWTPFMAPCFGTIARFAKKNGTTRILCQIDNVEPHERHMTDKPFNRYFLRAVDGFIYMSEQVHRELRRYTQVPALFSPHPLFENFGIVIDRTEACIRLELDPSKRYALFFGLIRDYKGLDLLLDAWKIYKREHPAEDRRLIVAGEFYAPKEKYLKQIADNGLEDDVILHDYFIPDELVRYYFSVADFLVQPYRSATQSGVTQIAYQFDLPMVVTDVGGLPEIVPEEAAIVRRIYARFMEGVTPHTIAKELTADGIPTPSGKPNWPASTVESILQNEKYKGAALLQKCFTVDFLTKKQKVNEGEVPQYYVEHF